MIRYKEPVFAWSLILFAIGLPLFQVMSAKFDTKFNFVSVFCNEGRVVYYSIDLETKELEGVFLVDSYKEGGLPNPPKTATSVKSEIIGNQQKSLGTYEWTLFQQEGTAALPKFKFKIPKEIKEKRLNLWITAQ